MAEVTVKTDKSIVDPNINPDTAGEATTEVVTAVAPFIPQNVRVAIYSVAGVVGAVSAALVPVVGGVVSDVLSVVAAVSVAASSVLAVSHINAKA